MSDQQAPRWWRQRRDLALAAAREAQGGAAVDLLHLDTDQRSAAAHVTMIADVDAGPIARRLRLAWAAVDEGANAAVLAYLEALELWDVREDLEVEQATAAAAAFRGLGEAMRAAQREIAAYSERFTSDFVHVTRTLDSLIPRRAAAEQAVAQARAAILSAEHDGLLVPSGRAQLASAEAHLLVVLAGPVRHGMEPVLQACGDAVAAAQEGVRQVAELPALRLRVQQRMSSLTTRAAGVAWRAGRSQEPVLHQLRQRYAHLCWADLEDAAREGREALAHARSELAAAAELSQEQRWQDAFDALSRARGALAQADGVIDAPAERLALLDAVSTDPQAAHVVARFAVRDAQKLLMAGPVLPGHAAALDALDAQLAQAQLLRERPHPNWLAYGRALDHVVDAARGLVVDIRASRALSHPARS